MSFLKTIIYNFLNVIIVGERFLFARFLKLVEGHQKISPNNRAGLLTLSRFQVAFLSIANN